MSDAATEFKTRDQRYSSHRGINRKSLPWRLWTKAKKEFWDPADIDFSQDIKDWEALTDEQRLGVTAGARGFMIGEEGVTLDIIPLLRCISDEGRLEETIFLTSFALEEAKHVDFFRTFFDAVGADPSQLPFDNAGQNGLFDGELQRVMTRLDTDRCPEAQLDASLTYNQFIEAVAAISGYKGWSNFFKTVPGLAGFQKGLGLVQKDERRHIAYGTYLCRRLIAANPELWEFVERRWEELTRPLIEQRQRMQQARQENGGAQQQNGGAAGYGSGGGGRGSGRFTMALIQRRLDVMAVARNMTIEEVEGGSMDELDSTNDLPPRPVQEAPVS